MWQSKGRSGYGDSTISGDYDSWDGCSMNGRQYRNEATMETRNLSGADYWQLRKQNRPTEEIPPHLHMLSKGKANIQAYADPTKPIKKKASIRDRISLADRQYSRMEAMSLELEQSLKDGSISLIEYRELKPIMDERLAKAWDRLAKTHKWDETGEDTGVFDTEINDSKKDVAHSTLSSSLPSLIEELNDDNFIKKMWIGGCVVREKVVHYKQKAAKYIQTLKEI